jgi:hypothetical protein
VPGHVPVSELCAFLSGLLGHVRQMRIVRDQRAYADAWYTVLVTFDTQDSADDCYRSLSGRPVRPSTAPSAPPSSLTQYRYAANSRWNARRMPALALAGGNHGAGAGVEMCPGAIG